MPHTDTLSRHLSISDEKEYWQTYMRGCRRISRVSMAFGFALFLLLQVMTYVLRVHTGGDNALLYAAIPFAGPIFLTGEMLMSSVSESWILVCLLFPCLLNFILSARYHDQKNQAMDTLDTLQTEEENNNLDSNPLINTAPPSIEANAVQQTDRLESVQRSVPEDVRRHSVPSVAQQATPAYTAASPKPTPLPRTDPAVKPSPLPPAVPVKPVPVSEKPSPRPQPQKTAAIPDYTLPKSKETQKAEEDYQKVLQDVLSMLNKEYIPEKNGKDDL